MKYNFVDAQEMHESNPDTFEAPSIADLKKVNKGSFVKVCHNDERFWVKVTKVVEDKVYGIVYNKLICGQPFDLRDKIVFEKRHIYTTE